MGHLAVKGLAPLLVLVLSAVALSLRAQGETSPASVKAECAVLDASSSANTAWVFHIVGPFQQSWPGRSYSVQQHYLFVARGK